MGGVSGGRGRDEGVGDAAIQIDKLGVGECEARRQGTVFGRF